MVPDTARPVGLKGFSSCLRAARVRGNPCCRGGYLQSWGKAASLGVAATSVGIKYANTEEKWEKDTFPAVSVTEHLSLFNLFPPHR